jgi:hypothetical protein
MAVEIEKPAISYTDEAQVALQRSLLLLERSIRARAADQAIKSRGTPAEVTGSDIEKAFRDIIGPDPRDMFEEGLQSQREYWRKSSRLQFISLVYTWVGLFLALIAGIYPFIRTQLLNPSVKFSVAFVLCGLLVAALGLSMRAYLGYRGAIRREETLRRYSRSFDYRGEPDPPV